VITYFGLIIGICVVSRETLRLAFGAAYSARMTMVIYRHIHFVKLLQFFDHYRVMIVVIKNNNFPVLICSPNHQQLLNYGITTSKIIA